MFLQICEFLVEINFFLNSTQKKTEKNNFLQGHIWGYHVECIFKEREEGKFWEGKRMEGVSGFGVRCVQE